jgi:N-acetylneuraminic acid mutarotase
MKSTAPGCLRSLTAIITFVLLTPQILLAQGAWTTEPSTGFTGVFAPGSGVIDGKIYVVGGQNTSFTRSKTVSIYDPATKKWTTPATTGTFTARRAFVCAVVNGKLYTIGGDTSSASSGKTSLVEVFDPATNSWSAPVTTGSFTPRIVRAGAVIDGKIYVMGGRTDSTSDLSTVDIFDPATNSWITPMTTGNYTPRSLASACVVNNKIYVIGGATGSSSSTICIGTLEVYDTVTNSWTTQATTGTFTPRYGMACVATGGRIYTMAGGFVGTSFSSILEIFDPSTNTWSTPVTTGKLTGRQCPTAEVVDGAIYLIGGSTGTPNWAYNEKYTPEATDVEEITPQSFTVEFSPNPTNGIVTVHTLPVNTTHITITNVLGQAVEEITNPQFSGFTIDLSRFPAGMYFARFFASGKAATKLIVRE